jgi:hypothetical protein
MSITNEIKEARKTVGFAKKMEIEAAALKATELVDDHPSRGDADHDETYDGPCACRECLSYGD